jgi:hypothetical protein
VRSLRPLLVLPLQLARLLAQLLVIVPLRISFALLAFSDTAHHGAHHPAGGAVEPGGLPRRARSRMAARHAHRAPDAGRRPIARPWRRAAHRRRAGRAGPGRAAGLGEHVACSTPSRASSLGLRPVRGASFRASSARRALSASPRPTSTRSCARSVSPCSRPTSTSPSSRTSSAGSASVRGARSHKPQPGPAGRQDRQRGAHRHPRRRDDEDHLRVEAAHGRPHGRPPGLGQDHQLGQAREVVQEPGPQPAARRRRPPAPRRGRTAPHARPPDRRAGLLRALRSGGGRPPRIAEAAASAATWSSSTPPAVSPSTPSSWSRCATSPTPSSPDYTFLVIDAMTGQDAVTVAEAFHATLELDGVILTKLDGDARGGAALSVKEVVGRPIAFASTGEKLADFDSSTPTAWPGASWAWATCSRSSRRPRRPTRRTRPRPPPSCSRGQFTLDDFLEQMQQLKKMGPLQNLIGMMPGHAQGGARRRDRRS